MSTEERRFTSHKPLAITDEALEATYQAHDIEDVADLIDGGIAVICIDGPLMHHGRGWWCDSYESILCRFKNAIECEDVRAVLLKIDSPGGEAAGVFETVKRMRELRASVDKPVYAYADEHAYSAAYALACAADEIYLPPGGGVGSVGVITSLVDISKADEKRGFRVEVIKSGRKKADGHPHVPLTTEVLERAQRRVDHIAKIFIRQVAHSRGLSPRDVKALEAGVFYDKDAVSKGLADGVMSLDEVIAAICYSLDNGQGTGSLQSASVQNARNSEPRKEEAMAKRLALLKALKDAEKALDKAKTPKERREAAKAYAAAQAAAEPEAPRADEEDEEDEEDDESYDGSESEDESESESSSTGSSSTGDSTGSESSMSEDEQARGRGQAGLYTAQRLLRMVEKATGEKGYERAMGALDAVLRERKETSKLRVKLEKRVAKLETKEKADKLDALIQQGIVSGKLTPAMRAWAGGQSHAALEAYLKAAPARVTREEDASEGDGESEEAMAEREATAAEAKVFGLMGLTSTDTGKDLTKDAIKMGGRLSQSFSAKRTGGSGEIKLGEGNRKFTINGVAK